MQPAKPCLPLDFAAHHAHLHGCPMIRCRVSNRKDRALVPTVTQGFRRLCGPLGMRPRVRDRRLLPASGCCPHRPDVGRKDDYDNV